MLTAFAIVMVLVVVGGFIAGIGSGIAQDSKTRKQTRADADEAQQARFARIDRELGQINWTKEDLYGIKQRRQRRGSSPARP